MKQRSDREGNGEEAMRKGWWIDGVCMVSEYGLIQV